MAKFHKSKKKKEEKKRKEKKKKEKRPKIHTPLPAPPHPTSLSDEKTKTKVQKSRGVCTGRAPRAPAEQETGGRACPHQESGAKTLKRSL